MHHPQLPLGAPFIGLPPNALLSSDAYIASRVFGSHSSGSVGGAGSLVVTNEATDTTCFPVFVTAATGDLAPKSNANFTFDSANSVLASGSLRAFGGIAPGVTADAVHAWVNSGTPILSIVNPTNAANARISDFVYGTGGGGTLSGRFANDSYGAAISWIDVIGTSAAIATITFPNGNIVVTNSVTINNTLLLGADTQMSRTAANRIGVPDSISLTNGGVAPSVAASNLNLWSTSAPLLDFVDAAQAANSRIANFSYQSGNFVGRFINDAYSSVTNWVTVVGTSAAITSVTFPTITVSGTATFNGNMTLGDAAADTITVTGTPAGQILGGTYTPTLTNVANLDASTAYSCQYMRVGSVVTVSGKVDVDPTLPATSTQLGISLPIASNLANDNECAGTAFANGIAGQGAAILGDATNNRAQMQWISGDVTNQPMFFTFTYRII